MRKFIVLVIIIAGLCVGFSSPVFASETRVRTEKLIEDVKKELEAIKEEILYSKTLNRADKTRLLWRWLNICSIWRSILEEHRDELEKQIRDMKVRFEEIRKDKSRTFEEKKAELEGLQEKIKAVEGEYEELDEALDEIYKREKKYLRELKDLEEEVKPVWKKGGISVGVEYFAIEKFSGLSLKIRFRDKIFGIADIVVGIDGVIEELIGNKDDNPESKKEKTVVYLSIETRKLRIQNLAALLGITISNIKGKLSPKAGIMWEWEPEDGDTLIGYGLTIDYSWGIEERISVGVEVTFN